LHVGHHRERDGLSEWEALIFAAVDPPECSRDGGGHEAVGKNLQAVSPRDNRFIARPRGATHDIAFRGFHAQGERGQSVGDKIDPQDLQGAQRRGPAGDAGDEHQQHFAGVAREEVVDELLDVVVDAAAFLHRGDDGGEVIVGEDHVGRLFGDIGPRHPHGDADVGGLHGLRVVDAVSGHGDNLIASLPGVYHLKLVLRGDAGIDGDGRHVSGQLVVIELVEFSAGNHAVVFRSDADLTGDGQRRLRMVAGDHHRLDAGLAALTDGDDCLFARRIDHAEEAGEDEIVFVRLVFSSGVELAEGDGEDAEAAGVSSVLSGARPHPRAPLILLPLTAARRQAVVAGPCSIRS
jgi:hypothetical protein